MTTNYFKNLRFFDRSGTPCNFSYDEVTDTWSGTMYFPRVSTSLYEVQHIFIIEDVIASGVPAVTFPVLGNQYQSPSLEDWRTRWIDDEAQNEIFTFIIVADNQGNPFIQSYEEIQYANSEVPYTFEASPGTLKEITTANSTALKINIAFTSKYENIYTRTMIIEDMSFATPKTIATIEFYGETVAEDERLRLVLENFGRTFNHLDELITFDSDINEPLPNWINTNNKRKELLLTGEEIYPYIGSYKGFINAIKFFGYQNLTVKEYWLNVDISSENYGKLQQYPLEGLFNGTYNPLQTNPLIGSTVYKKTSMFGLFYDITVATGEVDSFGLPITVDESMFTNEEVLVKLFALKQKLMDEYMPVSAKIIDITGEGIYFNLFGARTWSDPLINFSSNLGEVISFTSNVPNGYIRDLRQFMIMKYPNGLNLPIKTYTNTVNPYTSGQMYPPSSIPGLINSINTFYTELETIPFPGNGENANYKGDEPGILAGCPIILQATVDSFTWDDMNMTWDSLSTAASSNLTSPQPLFTLYTWDTINFSNFYECEWIIQKSGLLGYSFNIRGKISDYYKLPHFLPYAGTYNVTLKLYDLYNQFSICVQDNFIQVYDVQMELSAFCRFRNTDTYTWDGTTDTWDDLGGSTWYFPIEGVSPYNTSIDERLLEWARYQTQEDMQIFNESLQIYEDLIYTSEPNAINIGTRNIGTWDNMRISWDEMYHSTWDMYDYHAEFLGGFRIFNPQYGDTIQIDDYSPFVFSEPSPPTALTLQIAAAELNASTNPGISKFTYVVRFQQPLNTNIIIPFGTTITVGVGFTYAVTGNLTINGILINAGTVYVGGTLILGSTGIFNNTGTYFNSIAPYNTFIHACAKFAGADGWRFITYNDSANSPGIFGDAYSFRKPTWLGLINIDTLANEINASQTPNISVDRDLMFLDVPIVDLIKNAEYNSPELSPKPNTLAYWQQKGFLQTELPTSQFPYGQRRGHLPSWYGTGAFNSNDLRVFNDTGGEIPLGVPLFLVDTSLVPGRTNYHWVVTNSLTGKKVIETKGKPFLIIKFEEESFYTVECDCLDSNGNPNSVIKNAFIRVSSRINFGLPANTIYA